MLVVDLVMVLDLDIVMDLVGLLLRFSRRPHLSAGSGPSDSETDPD